MKQIKDKDWLILKKHLKKFLRSFDQRDLDRKQQTHLKRAEEILLEQSVK